MNGPLLRDLEPVSPANLADNRAVIQVAISMLDHVPKEPVHNLQDRQLEAHQSPELYGRCRVLDLILGGPAGLEIACNHPESVLTQNGRVGKAAQQGFTHFGRIGTAALSQQHGLRDRHDGTRHDHLVDKLRELTGAGWPDMGWAPHRLQEGARPLEYILGT